jgi:hypothetical protein
MDLALWLPPKEFQGNFLMRDFRGWLQKVFSVRYHTPRRLRKQERVRGYRDHGSMSSVSEKARKSANRVKVHGIDQEGNIVDYFAMRDSQEFRTKQKQEKWDPNNPLNRQNE